MAGSYLFFNGADWDLGDATRKLRNALFSGDISSVSQNGGQLAGLRNRIINGGHRVSQRLGGGGTAMANNVLTYGGADRMVSAVSGTTSSSVLVIAGIGAPAATGYAHQIGNITSTGPTTVQCGTFLEAADVYDMGGRTVTLSCNIWHNFGSAINWQAELNKPNALDNFSGWSQLAIGSAVSVPDSTHTEVSLTTTLAAADAVFGLFPRFYAAGLSALSNKSVYVSNMTLEISSKVTPFERRPFALEELLCQRYYYEVYPGVTGKPICQGSIYTTSELYCVIPFPTTMRIAPAITVSAPGDFAVLTNAGSAAPTSVSAGAITKHAAELYFAKTPATWTAGHSGWVRSANANSRHTFNAELT